MEKDDVVIVDLRGVGEIEVGQGWLILWGKGRWGFRVVGRRLIGK